MLIFSGYGLFIVAGIYAGCFWAMSKLTLNASDPQQTIALFITTAIATAISYLAARFLNRNEVAHTLYQTKLQNAVLAIGGLVEVLLLYTQWGNFMRFFQR